MRLNHRCLSVLAAVAICACGGSRQISPQSSLDTPQTQYSRGMLAFQEGDLWTAQAQSERAQGLDDDFPGSYAGAALVASAQGEFFRARQSISQALHRDSEFVDANIALGRVVVAEGQSKGRDTAAWLQEATRSFRRASRLAPERAAADFYLAQAQAQAGEIDIAMASYRRVIARNGGGFVSRAMAEAERLQIIQRAAPGTQLGARFAVQHTITHAELAVLLLEEMKLEELVRQRRVPDSPGAFRLPTAVSGKPSTTMASEMTVGIGSTWARPWLQRALELGLPGLEVAPDGTLGAAEIVSRAKFARVVEGILSLLTADDLPTRYVAL